MLLSKLVSWQTAMTLLYSMPCIPMNKLKLAKWAPTPSHLFPSGKLAMTLAVAAFAARHWAVNVAHALELAGGAGGLGRAVLVL